MPKCKFVFNSNIVEDLVDIVKVVDVQCPPSSYDTIKKLAFEKASFLDIPPTHNWVKSFTILEEE